MIARPLAPRAPIPFASPDRAVSTPSLTTRMAPAASGLPRRSPVQVPQAPEPSMHDGATVTARFTGRGGSACGPACRDATTAFLATVTPRPSTPATS